MRTPSWPAVLVLLLVLTPLAPAAAQDLAAKREKWAGMLAESHPARRRAALREMAMWHPQLEGTYDLVSQALADPDMETRIAAAEILVRARRDPRALSDLVDLAGPHQDKDTRVKALMAIAREPEAAVVALETLRSYTSDPDVGLAARYAVEAVEVRQKWVAAQEAAGPGPDSASAESPMSVSSPAPSPPRARRGLNGQLWLGLGAVGYALFTAYLRLRRPDSLAKLEAMKERWGDGPGTAVHWVAYTVVPMLVGLVLIVLGLRG